MHLHVAAAAQVRSVLLTPHRGYGAMAQVAQRAPDVALGEHIVSMDGLVALLAQVRVVLLTIHGRGSSAHQARAHWRFRALLRLVRRTARNKLSAPTWRFLSSHAF